MCQNLKKLSIKYKVDEMELSKAIKRIKLKKSILFAMSGKMGSGKDTIGDKIPNSINFKDYEIISTSYASPLRAEIEEIIKAYRSTIPHNKIEARYNVNINEVAKLSDLLGDSSIYDRTPDARKAIQYWGTDIRRNQDGNYWINKVVEVIIKSINSNKSIYVTDVRFPNEVESITDLGGKVVRLEAPSDVRSARILSRDGASPLNEHLYHLSETSLDDYVFDTVFDACEDPDELADQVRQYIKS